MSCEVHHVSELVLRLHGSESTEAVCVQGHVDGKLEQHTVEHVGRAQVRAVAQGVPAVRVLLHPLTAMM